MVVDSEWPDRFGIASRRMAVVLDVSLAACVSALAVAAAADQACFASRVFLARFTVSVDARSRDDVTAQRQTTRAALRGAAIARSLGQTVKVAAVRMVDTGMASADKEVAGAAAVVVATQEPVE